MRNEDVGAASACKPRYLRGCRRVVATVEDGVFSFDYFDGNGSQIFHFQTDEIPRAIRRYNESLLIGVPDENATLD